MSGRDPVDFFVVLPQHIEIHDRLGNWAKYVRDTPTMSAPQPMFRMYRPYLVPREPNPTSLVDPHDAMTMERAVAGLPERHGYAVRWAYVFPWRSRDRVQRVLCVTRDGLRDLIHDSRSMLKNRQTPHLAPQVARTTPQTL